MTNNCRLVSVMVQSSSHNCPKDVKEELFNPGSIIAFFQLLLKIWIRGFHLVDCKVKIYCLVVARRDQ